MKEYKFKINGKDYAVKIGETNGKNLTVNVNGADYEVELEQEIAGQAGNDAKPAAMTSGAAQPAAPAASVMPGPDRASQPSGPAKTIKSPLPGIIISIDVKEGQAVSRGQKVAVIEAMKMENDILAESDGTVTAIHAHKGDSVLEGADIVTIG
ncbi:MAG: biotin/lipoyl-binding protein [Bacteroidales bacterium]|nr:biotin/lipoyl-binding protein [Bacteroidales bacterium]